MRAIGPAVSLTSDSVPFRWGERQWVLLPDNRAEHRAAGMRFRIDHLFSLAALQAGFPVEATFFDLEARLVACKEGTTPPGVTEVGLRSRQAIIAYAWLTGMWCPSSGWMEGAPPSLVRLMNPRSMLSRLARFGSRDDER